MKEDDCSKPDLDCGSVTEPEMKSTTEILTAIRGLMSNAKFCPQAIQAYIVPSQDAHQSEYLADKDERRRFVCGFSGSAGVAIITEKEALLWTDGRYYLQASQEMDCNWTLMKAGLPTTLTQAAWLTKNLPSGSYVGVDPMLISLTSWNSIATTLEKNNQFLIPIERNLVDEVWKESRKYPDTPILPLNIKYTGRQAGDKVDKVREEMKEKEASVLVLTALDEIAYLLNLRGSQIEYNPVFFAYVIVTLNKVLIFINPCKITKEILEHFETENLEYELHKYETVKEKLEEIVASTKKLIWINEAANFALNSVVPEKRKIGDITPVELMKAVKNITEADGMNQAHIRDGVALCCYFAWLAEEVPKGGVTEISGANKSYEFRKLQKDFVGLSFATISSSGPHGAIIHYHPTEITDRPLNTSELYLCDSGAQYLDGTTDVTRTMHFGTPTDYEREKFTRVLKGQIALRTAVFPNKIRGNTLDTLARKYLWDVGLDYAHGTGHGIGMYLNVHEGPMGITWRQMPNDPGLVENMFLSNEPGYYEDGRFGIRIEDIVQIVKADFVSGDFAGRGALEFKTITMVPIQTKMMMPSMMTDKEIELINDYHKTCLEVLGPLLKEQEQLQAYDWLVRETRPLTRDEHVF